jgi:glycosyltransferase involved in cell wall biosynthesis
MRVALVTDWLTGFAGGEQVLLALHEMFPEAPIYTSLYRPEKVPQFKNAKVIPSYLQKIPGLKNHHQLAFPLMPRAFEAFNLKEYDVIISVGQGPAKGVITHPYQRHIAYCNTPMRFIWKLGGDTRNEGRWDSALRSYVSCGLRIWDFVSASRVDQWVANSETTKQRIAKIYRDDAVVVYPPVDTARFQVSEKNPEEYYLSVCRLVDYKRVDILIEACKTLKRPLKVVGGGPDEGRLRQLAAGSEWITFLGRVPDTELQTLYAESKGFLFGSEEDFGIVPVEAMSAGRPVVAYGRGGVSESVLDGVTGILFHEQNPDSVVQAILKLEEGNWNKQKIRSRAEEFDTEVFKKKIKNLIES